MGKIPLFFDRSSYIAQITGLKSKNLARRQVLERSRFERKQIKISKEIFYEQKAIGNPQEYQLPPDPDIQNENFLDNSEKWNDDRMLIENNNQSKYQLNSYSIFSKRQSSFLGVKPNSNSMIDVEENLSGF